MKDAKIKLNEDLALSTEYSIYDLDDALWDGGYDRWSDYNEEQKEFLMDYFEEHSYGGGSIPSITDFNDFIWLNSEDVLKEANKDTFESISTEEYYIDRDDYNGEYVLAFEAPFVAKLDSYKDNFDSVYPEETFDDLFYDYVESRLSIIDFPEEYHDDFTFDVKYNDADDVEEDAEEFVNGVTEMMKDYPINTNESYKRKSKNEGYQLWSGEEVECYSDYYKARERAKELGLKEAEYGDVYGTNYSYVFYNKSGDRYDDEEVIAYYKFENGKPVPLDDYDKEYFADVKDIYEFDESINHNRVSNKPLKENASKSLTNVVRNIDVNCPKYRGASMPKFDRLKINESEFADELRFKYYDIDVANDDGQDYIKVEWSSQLAPIKDDDLQALYDEIIRAVKENLTANKYNDSVNILIHYTDRDDTYEDYYDDTIDIGGNTHYNESLSLNERIADEVYEYADEIADRIAEVGSMRWDDIDDIISELSGKDLNQIQEEEINLDVYATLGYYGINQNTSTGEFYTDEYAEEHPEVIEESTNLKEMPVRKLNPVYDSRKSFYGKAKVDDRENGNQKLYSYNTLVAEIKDGVPVVYDVDMWDSQTTLRHIKDFLAQNGFGIKSKREIIDNYLTHKDEWTFDDEEYEDDDYLYEDTYNSVFWSFDGEEYDLDKIKKEVWQKKL